MKYDTIDLKWNRTIHDGDDSVQVRLHETKLLPAKEDSRLKARQYIETLHFEDGQQFTIVSVGDQNIWFGEDIGVHYRWSDAAAAAWRLQRERAQAAA